MIGKTNAQASAVTGVKGDNESSYRTGNVSLTPANIGAVSTASAANLATYSNGVITIKELVQTS